VVHINNVAFICCLLAGTVEKEVADTVLRSDDQSAAKVDPDRDPDAGIPVKYDESARACGHTADSGTLDNDENGTAAETDALKSQYMEKVNVSTDGEAVLKERDQNKSGGCWRILTKPVVVYINAWKTYARQRVVFASIALSLLYMTVLGFDSITTGLHLNCED
jgi:Ferroportin1 (FPN1)